MADIVQFPARAPRLRLIETESRDYLAGQVIEANICLNDVSGDVADAIAMLQQGNIPRDDHPIMCGASLADALQAVVHLVNIRSTTEDRPIFQAAVKWLAVHTGDTPDAG